MLTEIVSKQHPGPGDRILFRNARLATLRLGADDLGAIDKGAIATNAGKIAFVGSDTDLPAPLIDRATHIVDLDGRWVSPGLIDCHTHIVHGGNRAHEFQMRQAGASYQDIALAGGGIASTVRATRALSIDELVETALLRVDLLLKEGVTTIEIKSGYGLDMATELRMLQAARAIGQRRPVRVLTSYLAAHATPPEYKGRTRDYLREVVLPGLEAGHSEGLIDAVDGFCESIAFSPDEIALVFKHAQKLGLPVKLHAEQLSNVGGAKLAASRGALSADHLEYLDEEGARAMAEAGTVAVLLPGAFYALRETRPPPVQILRDRGVPIAIATDCNPGTSPLTSLLLTMNLAATLFGLSVGECIAGATREAARALGLLAESGTLEVGKTADFAIWNIEHPAELVYRMGFNALHARVFKGQVFEI